MSNCSSLVSSLQCKNPSSHEMRELPVDFVLGEHDVFCGRGGRCFNHTGNRRFRSKVMSRLGEYSKAKSKYDKTAIIDEIISEVRCLSPNGGFVRRDVGTGRYFEVGDFLAVSVPKEILSTCIHCNFCNVSNLTLCLEKNYSAKKLLKHSEMRYKESINHAMQIGKRGEWQDKETRKMLSRFCLS